MITTLEILSKEDCQKLREELEKFKFSDGKTSASGRARDIKDNYQLEGSRSDAEYIFDGIKKLLNKHPFLANKVAPVAYPRIFANYYAGGQHYGWHVDTALMNGMRTDFSFTISLKEPDTYEGGALEMKLANGEIQSFRLPAGHMVIYPTGQLHRVTEVTSGFRLSIVGWIQSAYSDEEDRNLVSEYSDLMSFMSDKYQLDLEQSNRFSQFKQKLVRRLLK